MRVRENTKNATDTQRNFFGRAIVELVSVPVAVPDCDLFQLQANLHAWIVRAFLSFIYLSPLSSLWYPEYSGYQ